MKNECNIIIDILPLYVENMVSIDTKEFVENHICHCEKCKKKLESLYSDIPFEKDYQEVGNPVNMMKKIGLDINKKRVFTGVISAIISAVIIMLSFAYLTAPEYLPYTESFDILSVDENNGSVTLSFTGEYELSQRALGVYDVSIYNTLWNQIFRLSKTQTIKINPNGQDVNAIYFVSNEGFDDVIIYGENPIVNGGALTLPRLFLNYYFTVAILMSLALMILLLLFKKNQKIKIIIIKILFAPISYILAHVTITGFNGASYSAARDFYLILLVTMLLYCLIYLLYKKKFCK